jgi:hypothetical protein
VSLTRRILTAPSGVLLQVQLLGIIVYPFLGDRPLGRAIFGVFGLLVLVLALRVVRSTPALTWVAVLLGVPVAVLTVLEGVFTGHTGIALASAVLHCVFYGYTAVALIRYMFHDERVTLDELLATGATFTVVAWAFAYAYAAVQIIWPGSFVGDATGDRRSWMELLFLSVTVLTSTGISDIVPLRPHARAAVMIEQIAGMLYIALVIARMTALTVIRPGRERSSAGHDR